MPGPDRGRVASRQGIVAAMTTFPLALDGIRVLDLSRVIAGPWCGALLGDFGADVIKVEDTGEGDESRTWPPRKDGETAAYLLFNRNKRGMTLDLKSPDGVGVIKALVQKSDVLVENFRTGTMESFGLGYDVLAAINPRLIYCSVSAFGRTGPRKDSPGYEALMQAFSGIMSITGEPGGPPVRSAVSFLDLTTGILCALGVTAAVHQRERTGLGQRVDGSLLDTAIALLAYHAEGYLLAGLVPKALGSGHPSLSPYRNFKCRDGQWIFIAAANDRFWGKLTRALGLEAMAADPRFVKNGDRVAHRVELEAMLEKIVGEYDREPLLKRLEEADVPATPVNTVDQVMNDPQTIARGMIERVVHPKLGEIPVVGTPLKFSRMTPGVRRAAPLRGEHTDAVLAECGLSPERIRELRDKKVIL
jgi:crotonobetainyl-CoA:carnitine CoA-transferase CaiB-like acyl-CoA transferase